MKTANVSNCGIIIWPAWIQTCSRIWPKGIIYILGGSSFQSPNFGAPSWWHPLISGTLKLDSTISLFTCGSVYIFQCTKSAIIFGEPALLGRYLMIMAWETEMQQWVEQSLSINGCLHTFETQLGQKFSMYLRLSLIPGRQLTFLCTCSTLQ